MNREIYNYLLSIQNPFQYYVQIEPRIPGPGRGRRYPRVECLQGTPIDRKYCRLTRSGLGFSGNPIIPEYPTAADGGVGRYRIYRNGEEWIILWHPETGAHEIHGAIYRKWQSLGDNYGFPITDELMTPDGIGRFNHFRRVHEPDKPEGSIYFKFGPDRAYFVYGPIRAKWAELGWERSPLGYPISDEQDRPEGGKIQHFERGSIAWTNETGAYVVGSTPPPRPVTPTPSPVTPPTPSKPTINVFKRNSKIIVTGSNFSPNASIRIRVVVGVPGNEFSDYANSDGIGSFKEHEIDLSYFVPGTTIWVSATDGRRVPTSQDITGFLWSNTVPLYI